MLKNRLTYGFIVLVFLLFVYLNESPLTYGVLYALFILPIFSFLMTWFSKGHFFISGSLNTNLILKQEKAQFTVVVKNHHLLPHPMVCLRLDANHMGLGLDQKEVYFSLPAHRAYEAIFHLEGIYRGEYEVGIEYLAIYDFLGLFKFKHLHPKRDFLTVTPNVFPIPPLPLDALEQPVEKEGRLKHFETSNTVSELRPYQRADSQRQIHWKASAKRGELISKEFQPQPRQTIDFFIDNRTVSGKAHQALEKEDRFMEYVASSVDQCAKSRYPITLHYLDPFNRVPPRPHTDALALYREVSNIRFNHKDDFGQLLHNHATSDQPLNNVVVFAHQVDEGLLSGLKALNMKGHRLIFYSPENLENYHVETLTSLDVTIIQF